jgi:ADP-ribosylglycohydrolase
MLLVLMSVTGNLSASAETVRMSELYIKDKIRGGWAGQVIGCTFGGPTEFRYRSTVIPDSVAIELAEGAYIHYYENSPGLYDDLYMDLTFVDVLEKEGLDATPDDFALAFAHAGYRLWHANQSARYNILRGIMPPESGHWLDNPCADDIDFQIEADFAGIMCPGMPAAALDVCDRAGHVMNSGDGYYGGVYVAAMYALAYVSNDIGYVVSEALKSVPEESLFHQCIADVIRWHSEYPDDWHRTWQATHDAWDNDIGCPQGVFTTFNIDAKINAAWIVTGLLYGGGDFGRTVDISTRCGDDSDCNPANAGGILGVMLGYDGIPAEWRRGLREVESRDFAYTDISLDDACELSWRHACGMLGRNGGEVEDGILTIPIQTVETAPFERNFAGHIPIERRELGSEFADETTFTFTGVGFAVNGGPKAPDGVDMTVEVAVEIDGVEDAVMPLPTSFTTRAFTPFWRYRLPNGAHTVRLRVLNPREGVTVKLDNVVVYGSGPE